MPALEYVLAELPTGPDEVATVPQPAYVKALAAQQAAAPDKVLPSFAYLPGFIVTYRGSAEVDLVRYTSDSLSTPPRPFLTRVGAWPIFANQDGKDSRGLAIDASDRQTCEAACPGGGSVPNKCLLKCASTFPLRMFIANRAPASLLVAKIDTELVTSNDEGGTRTTGASDSVTIYDSIPLDTGPSHVAIGKVIDMDGNLATRVFAVCFDTRFIFMYDPAADRVQGPFSTGRGPQAIAFDTGEDENHNLHSFLFVAHFTDSYLGVIDLDMRNPTFGTMFATIGEPLPPRESR
jgi:hypothetical protein